jgi:hypothetical protein
MVPVTHGYTRDMSDDETPPPVDAERTVTNDENDLDPEAPTDSTRLHPPRVDADRPVPALEDDAEDLLQEENAGSSLDQPSDETS